MPDVDAREQRWPVTVDGDGNLRGIGDKTGSVPPAVVKRTGLRVIDVVPAARLAEVERERDELAAVVAATWAHVAEEGQAVDPASLADRTDVLLRLVCWERDIGQAAHAREIEEFRCDWLAAIDDANDRQNERDEARAALERAREALEEIQRATGHNTMEIAERMQAIARAALDALPAPTETTAEEKRDGA